eukprot:TRINITY_DN8030_c0_g1_i1.p1 TRINITY_DN8030_c0_g1~~TRINITY_DN8030_c0_g1_i1.p1  ORF type:complete len:444 (+),score=145.67 TRINITY_DN8030_c0_g1_i1:50-1333(+)
MPVSYSSSTESSNAEGEVGQCAKGVLGSLCTEVKCSIDWLTGLSVADGEMYTAGYDGTASVVCKKVGRVKKQLSCKSPVMCVAFFSSSNRRRILTGDSEGTLTIWNHTYNKISEIELGKATSLATWDGRAYITSGKTVNCVDIEKAVLETSVVTQCTNNIIIIEEGVIYTGGDGMVVSSFAAIHGEGEKMRLLRTFKGMSSSVLSLAGSKTMLAAGGYDGHIKAWNLITGASMLTLKAHSSFVSSLAFTSTGLELWSGSGDGFIKSWEVNSGQCSLLIDTKAEITSIHLEEFAGKIFSSNRSGSVKSFYIRNTCAGIESSAMSDSAPSSMCTQACRKIAAQEYQQAHALFQHHLEEIQGSFTAKLDVMRAEKDALSIENKRLHDIIRKLTLENQRLLNTHSITPVLPADGEAEYTHDLDDIDSEMVA